MAKRKETIRRLCTLTMLVTQKVYGWKKPADCLCEENNRHHQATDEEVIDFIEKAVKERIAHMTQKGE